MSRTLDSREFMIGEYGVIPPNDTPTRSPHAIKVGGGFDLSDDPGVTTSYRKRLTASGTPAFRPPGYEPSLAALRRRTGALVRSDDAPDANDLTYERLKYSPKPTRYVESVESIDSYNARRSRLPIDLHYDYSNEGIELPKGWPAQTTTTETYSASRLPLVEAPVIPPRITYDRPRETSLPYERRTYERPSVERITYDRPTYDRTTYDRTTYDRPTYDRPSYDLPTYVRSPESSVTYERPHKDPIYVENSSMQLSVPKADSPTIQPPRKKLPLVPRVAYLGKKSTSQVTKEDIPSSTSIAKPVRRDPSPPPKRNDYDIGYEKYVPKEKDRREAAAQGLISDDYATSYSRYSDKYNDRYDDSYANKKKNKYDDFDDLYQDTKGKDKYPSGPSGTYGSRYEEDVHLPPESDTLEKYSRKYLGKHNRPDDPYHDEPEVFPDIDIDNDYDIDGPSSKARRNDPKMEDRYDLDAEDDYRYDDMQESFNNYKDDVDYLPTFTPSSIPKPPAAPKPANNMVKYVIMGVVAIIALYAVTKVMAWWRRGPSGRISCGSYEFAACKEQGCSYDPESRSCYLPSPSAIVKEAAFKTPYRFLFLGHPSADTRTCINSMVKAYSSGMMLARPVDAKDYYQKTAMDQVELYDTPPMDLTTDLEAFYKVRKFVAGVEMAQNFSRHPFSWVTDKTNAASRIALVLDMRPAVRGWFWHTVKQSGIAYFIAQLEKVDTALPVAPLVLINTMGYKAKTANKIRDALRRAYRLEQSSVFAVDCNALTPLDLSKMLYSVFLDNKYTAMKLESFAL